MRKLAIITSVAIGVGLISCGEQTREKKTSKMEESKSAEKPIKLKSTTYYPIPSPEQMFNFINDQGVEYRKELISDPGVANSFSKPTDKALNFGIYIADLTYAASFEDIESTVKLYKVVKQLGAEMNLEEIMSEERMAKMQENMQNPDSLSVIAAESYYQAVEQLEANGQQGKLALISLGGWIESMYITTQSIEKYKAGTPSLDRIASQKITFGNLYAYLKNNEDKVGVQEMLSAVQPIRSVYAKLKENSSKSSTEKTESGKLVFGKGKTISISESQFNELKTTVKEIRTQLITTEA